MVTKLNMTPEEFENSNEFKLMKRILKSEFSWILDVLSPDEENLNRWTSLSLNLVINPYMLQNLYGWKIESYVTYFVLKNEPYSCMYFAVIFGKEDEEETMKFQKEFEKTMTNFYKQIIINIPEEIRNKNIIENKRNIFQINRLIVPPKSLLPVPNNVVLVEK